MLLHVQPVDPQQLPHLECVQNAAISGPAHSDCIRICIFTAAPVGLCNICGGFIMVLVDELDTIAFWKVPNESWPVGNLHGIDEKEVGRCPVLPEDPRSCRGTQNAHRWVQPVLSPTLHPALLPVSPTHQTPPSPHPDTEATAPHRRHHVPSPSRWLPGFPESCDLTKAPGCSLSDFSLVLQFHLLDLLPSSSHTCSGSNS